MIKRFSLIGLLLLALGLPLRGPAQNTARPNTPTQEDGWVELHRLRFVNHKEGAVQVSTDGGVTWALLGRVLVPATTVSEGFLAANYAEPGTVVATAVHGIRIRTGANDPTLHAPLLLSINPREYVGPVNRGFGGYVAGSAGVFTDIAAGNAIFRGLAPLVGNPAFLERASGRLDPLPPTFRPAGQGEVLVIVVRRPANPLVEVTLPNQAGGEVSARFADGDVRIVTRVRTPVRGVGRFDGTAYTGVGRINTAHTGVITVSTAPIDAARPEGEGRERRGGFQISPVWHNARTPEAGAPMVMTLGIPGERRRDLEGKPPLFRDMVSLLDGTGGAPAVVDVSIDDGPWEPMPALVGARLDGFTGPGLTRLWKTQKKSRKATRGVTAFRLRLPLPTLERSRTAQARDAGAYQAARFALARAGKLPLVQGLLTINASPTDTSKVSFVRFFVEGAPKGFTNRAPFTLSWDTTRVPNGEYLVEAEALDAGGATLATTRQRVFVHNPAASATRP